MSIKNRLKTIAFSVLACGLVLGGSEAVLRIVKPAFVYRTKAAFLYNRITFQGIAPELYDEDYIHTILNTREIPLFRGKNLRWLAYMEERNSRGFRGPEFSEKKPEGNIRIICLGDSITWDGWYIEELEERLVKKYPDYEIEVLNCGLPGRPSLAGLLLFREEIIKYEPDLVIFGYAINDMMLHQTELGRLYRSSSRWMRFLTRCLNSSHTYLALKALVFKVREKTFDPANPSYRGRDQRFSLKGYKENLVAVAREARKEGIRLLFFTSHSPFYYPDLERYNKVMEAVAAEESVALLNVREAMLSENLPEDERKSLESKAGNTFSGMLEGLMGRSDLMYKILDPIYIFYYDFFHPNTKGHQVIGGNLAGVIINEGLLQAAQSGPGSIEEASLK